MLSGLAGLAQAMGQAKTKKQELVEQDELASLRRQLLSQSLQQGTLGLEKTKQDIEYAKKIRQEAEEDKLKKINQEQMTELAIKRMYKALGKESEFIGGADSNVHFKLLETLNKNENEKRRLQADQAVVQTTAEQALNMGFDENTARYIALSGQNPFDVMAKQTQINKTLEQGDMAREKHEVEMLRTITPEQAQEITSITGIPSGVLMGPYGSTFLKMYADDMARIEKHEQSLAKTEQEKDKIIQDIAGKTGDNRFAQNVQKYSQEQAGIIHEHINKIDKLGILEKGRKFVVENKEALRKLVDRLIGKTHSLPPEARKDFGSLFAEAQKLGLIKSEQKDKDIYMAMQEYNDLQDEINISLGEDQRRITGSILESETARTIGGVSFVNLANTYKAEGESGPVMSFIKDLFSIGGAFDYYAKAGESTIDYIFGGEEEPQRSISTVPASYRNIR